MPQIDGCRKDHFLETTAVAAAPEQYIRYVAPQVVLWDLTHWFRDCFPGSVICIKDAR